MILYHYVPVAFTSATPVILLLKERTYAELKKVRDELRDLTVHTANYEELRDLEEREKRKEKEHGRE